MKKTALALALLAAFEAQGATPVAAGTDLATVLNTTGEYELQAGTHTVTAGFTMGTGVVITCADGASLLIDASVTLKFDDSDVIRGCYIRMANNSRLMAEAVSGNASVSFARIADNTFVPSGDITTAPSIRLGQGFNSYHRHLTIENNDFFGVVILEEVGDAIRYVGNHWYDVDNLRPLQLWGSNHVVERNYLSGGIFGISFLGKHNIAANRRPCTGNYVNANIVLGTTEEGISFDVVGNVAAETVLREYDTVATTPGSPNITLASANWAAQTTYNGSLYDLVFTSGTLAGKRYKIATHSGATFGLTGIAADYASIGVGNGVSIQLSCYGNTVTNNLVMPKLIEERSTSSGIVFHGTGTENLVQNNIAYGYRKSGGAGGDWYNYHGIIENSLNGIVATDSITGNQRRGPVGGNTIRYNFVPAGGLGHQYRDYGSNPSYTVAPSTYSNNTEGVEPGFSGGLGKYRWRPRFDAPVCGVGFPVPGLTFDMKRRGTRTDIGPFACESWR